MSWVRGVLGAPNLVNLSHGSMVHSDNNTEIQDSPQVRISTLQYGLMMRR